MTGARYPVARIEDSDRVSLLYCISQESSLEKWGGAPQTRDLVEGIELTANAGEVGQSEVQLEQFWIFSKAVPPRKSARSAAFSPRIEIAVNAVS